MVTTADTRARAARWHVRNWDTLGWLETAAKGAGIGVAVLGAIYAGRLAPIEISGLGYGVAGIAGLLSLGAVAQLLLRVKQRELISLAFAVVNLIGHAALLWVVLTAPAVAWPPLAFGAAYLVGELVKQRFLAVTGYTENGQSSGQMRFLSGAVALLYGCLIILAILG